MSRNYKVSDITKKSFNGGVKENKKPSTGGYSARSSKISSK